MPLACTMEPGSTLMSITGSAIVSSQERNDCLYRLVRDQTTLPDGHILIDVHRITNAPATEDSFSIVSLNNTLKSRFAGRLAILSNAKGRVTATRLVVTGAKSGPENLRPLPARQWHGSGCSMSSW